MTTALLGPRQTGKTTLARQIVQSSREAHHFDLEDPDNVRALDHAKPTLDGLKGLVVIDEWQRRPNSRAPFLISRKAQFPTTR